MNATCSILFDRKLVAKGHQRGKFDYRIMLMEWQTDLITVPTFELRTYLEYRNKVHYDTRIVLRVATREEALTHTVHHADDIIDKYEAAIKRSLA